MQDSRQQHKEKSIQLEMLPEIVEKSRRGFPVYATNPFLSKFTVSLRPRQLTVARGSEVIDSDGDTIAETNIAQIKLVDDEEFIKVYTKNIQKFFELSLTATRILQIFLVAIQKTAINQDEVFLDFKEAKKIFSEYYNRELAQSTFTRGIMQLIVHEFIAESPRSNFFYINPNLIFNGDRVAFITEYRKRDSYLKAEKKLKALIEDNKEHVKETH